ncbi:kinesin-like protein Klp61F [Anopheles aquasalis]|uniref:kinesin-like protein Klp61F n=1 Tax=Anopheles aquasalis TaxID=42839 RepID=UPI00215B768E|nr:kinesin-like protein Klp61F [Anopheles aquasalis]
MDASSNGHSNSSGGTHGKPQKCNQNVQVYVRVRPTNSRERLIRSQEIVEVISPREVHLKSTYNDSRTSKKFTFDRAFCPGSKQNEVYHSVVAPYIEEVLAGFNCTVFAYGQTGTGKTFTMVGEEEPELSAAWEDDTMTGIIPRAVNHLFDELRLTELEFSMRISYLELYNEELCDLLSTDDSVKIRIFDDVQKKGSVIVQGLEEIPVHSKDDVYKLLTKGQERRKTASTLMNAQSSRSHTIFSIIVHIKENGIDGEEMLKIGKLNLVDLAGSENISKAGNEKGIRTRETVNINQSLLTLGRVITALVEKTPHIPYRESKLTRLLQESLGGRTKTSIIATISPGHKDFEETLSTLEYAHRAKNIQNKPEANQKLSKKTVIKEYTEEIDRLKRDLMAARDKNGIFLAEETYNEMVYKSEAATKELNDKSALIKAMKDELAKKESIFREVAVSLEEREEELRRTVTDLGQTREELTSTKRNLSKTKRRYVEKKVVLEEHLKTEQVLTGQAKELISVVEMVTEDADGLHDTVDRRREVDNKNRTATEMFVNRVRNRITTIQSDVSGLVEQANQLTKALNAATERHDKDDQKLHAQTVDFFSTLETVSQSLVQENTGLVEGFKAALGDQQNVQYNAAIQYLEQVEQSRNAMLQSFMATLEEVKAGLRETVQRHTTEQQSQWLKLIGHCKTRDTRTTEFCASLGNKLFEMETLVSQFEQSRNRLQEYRQQSELVHLETLDELRKIEKNAKSFYEDQLTSFFQRMYDATKRRAELSQTVTALQEDLKGQEQATQQHIAAIRQSVGSEESAIGEGTTVREQLTKQWDELKRRQNRATEEKLQQTPLDKVELRATELANAIAQERTRLDDAQQDAQQRLASFVDAVATTNDSFQEAQRETFVKVQTCMQAQETGRQEFACSARDHTGRLTETFVTLKRKANEDQLIELQAEVEKFRQRELTFYEPTGKTPIRKRVQYPRDVPMTAPDERIIRRYWRERGEMMDMSMTICEDEETISPLKTEYQRSNEIRNSTPLTQKVLNNVLDEDREHFKELHISKIDSKVLSTAHVLVDEYDKENKTIEEVVVSE